jgi:transposase
MQAVIQRLQALRGEAHISAVTIVSELGNVSSRSESARKLMGHCGVFSSEDYSGKRKRQGSITRGGNAHLRRFVVEGGVSLELSTPAQRRGQAAWATGRGSGRGRGNCVEDAKPPAQALRGRKKQKTF